MGWSRGGSRALGLESGGLSWRWGRGVELEVGSGGLESGGWGWSRGLGRGGWSQGVGVTRLGGGVGVGGWGRGCWSRGVGGLYSWFEITLNVL